MPASRSQPALSPAARRRRGHPTEAPVRAVTALAVTVLAVAALAVPAVRADESPGRFFIEAIRVENARLLPEELIVAETLLEPGREYDEQELREAAYRVARLPMVLDAEPLLRRGSEPERYELWLRVEEARRWFFRVDGQYQFWSPEVAVNGLELTDVVDAGNALVGYRRAVGRRGVMFAALSGGEGLFNLGYARHDLGPRRALLSAGLSISDCAPDRSSDRSDPGDQGCQTLLFSHGLDPTFSTWSTDANSAQGRLALGVPIGDNHSLRLRARVRNGNSGIRRQAFEPEPGRFFEVDRRHDQQLELAWVFDSTDDPVFPTTGRRLEAGIVWRHLSADLVDFEGRRSGGGPPLAVEMDSRELALATAAETFFSRGRDTLSLRAEARLGRTDLDSVPTADLRLLDGGADVWQAGVGVGHSRLLLLRRGQRSWRELRWETGVSVHHSGTSPSFGLVDDPLLGLRAGTGLAFRTTWGLFSLRLDYIDFEVGR